MATFPDLYSLIQGIDGELDEALRRAPQTERRQVPEAEMPRKYILVTTGILNLAIAIDDLAEVGPLPALTFLPNLPSWIQGIVNIRGEIVSVIDLPGFLGLPGAVKAEGPRLVVVRHEKIKVGIRLDRIVGTVSRTASETSPLERHREDARDALLFISGISMEGSLYAILNVRSFLTAPRLVDYNRLV
jgi:chemotaxis signal transduction protein